MKSFSQFITESHSDSKMNKLGYEKIADWTANGMKTKSWSKNIDVPGTDRHRAMVITDQRTGEEPVFRAMHVVEPEWYTYQGEGRQKNPRVFHDSSHSSMADALDTLDSHLSNHYKANSPS